MCPHCQSENVRPAEKGMVSDGYYCLDCQKAYTTASPKAKWSLMGIVSAVALTLIGIR